MCILRKNTKLIACQFLANSPLFRVCLIGQNATYASKQLNAFHAIWKWAFIMRPMSIVMKRSAYFGWIYQALGLAQWHSVKNLLPMAYVGRITGNDAVYLWHLRRKEYAKCIWSMWRSQLNRWKNTEKVRKLNIYLRRNTPRSHTSIAWLKIQTCFKYCCIVIEDKWRKKCRITKYYFYIFIESTNLDTIQNCRLSKQIADGNVPFEAANIDFDDELANELSSYHQLSMRRASGCSGIYEEISVSPDSVKRYTFYAFIYCVMLIFGVFFHPRVCGNRSWPRRVSKIHWILDKVPEFW